MKLPCKGCITLSVCKGHKLEHLIVKCSLLDSYIEVNSVRRKEKGMRLTYIRALVEFYKHISIKRY